MVDLIEVVQREVHSLAILRGRDDRLPLVLDVTFEEPVSRMAEATSAPVENTGTIADHVRRSPPAVRFRGLLVNEQRDPIEAGQRSNAATAGSEDPLRSARENGPQVDRTRASSLLDELIAIHESDELVLVVTAHSVFDRMLLTSLDHRPQTQSSIEISGAFTQIRIARTEFAPIPAQDARTSKPAKNAGTKATTGADLAPRDRSILHSSFQ